MNNPSAAEVINNSIDAKLLEIFTALPAKVVRVDVKKGMCDAQPVLKRKYADGTVVELPVIVNIPIASYRAGQAYITLPLKVGDFVMLHFSQRSLDIWLSKGGTVDPLDPRHHHISDAVAYLGVYPFTDAPTDASPDNIVIKNASSKITIKPDQIELYGNGDAIALASKVLSELNGIKSAFDSHTHLYNPGPGGPTPTQAPAAPMPAPQSVASTKVKAE